MTSDTRKASFSMRYAAVCVKTVAVRQRSVTRAVFADDGNDIVPATQKISLFVRPSARRCVVQGERTVAETEQAAWRCVKPWGREAGRQRP